MSDRLAEAEARQQRYNEVVEQRDEARYKLDKLRQRHADVVNRLELWASANDEERKAGKTPTFLNPHTVLAWLGEDASDAKARLT